MRSIVVASSIDGSEGTATPVTSEVTAEFSTTRRGREAALITELDIKRATSWPWPACANDDGEVATNPIAMNASVMK